jgi:CRISP-associated protein Cas1
MTKDPWSLVGPGAPLEDAPEPIRRLVPARDDRIPLYVQAPGARIGLDGDRLRVEVGGSCVADARLPNTSHVALYENAQISTQALAALLDRDIPVVFLSSGGWFRGRTVGHGNKNADLRVAQHRAAASDEIALELLRAFVAAKIRNQRTLLRRNASQLDVVALGELEALAKKAERCESVESMLGLEGAAARVYFGRFASMLKGGAAEDFDLDGRNRRPPRDPINALLSFAYSLLAKDITLAVVVAGLDPLVGFLHRPRYGRPALALDLMEEMRPIVADSAVVTAVNTGVIVESDFIRTPAGCALTPGARKKFLASWERRIDQLVAHPIFGYRVSYRRIFEVQARLLGCVLLGEVPAYPAFRTR